MGELKVTDEQINTQWVSMLKVFETIIDGNPPIEKVKDKLEGLKLSAGNSVLLTARQKEGIVGRCNHYLKGEYGHQTQYLKEKLNGIK